MPGKIPDTWLRAVKATGKTQKKSDGGALFMEVTPKGSKLWRMAYRYEGKQKLLSFGKYPAVSLADARKKRDMAKELLAKGIDPAAEKRRQKEEADQAREIAEKTFQVVANEWFEGMAREWSASNIKKKRRLLEVLFRGIADKPVTNILPTDVIEILRHMTLKVKM